MQALSYMHECGHLFLDPHLTKSAAILSVLKIAPQKFVKLPPIGAGPRIQNLVKKVVLFWFYIDYPLGGIFLDLCILAYSG